MNRILFEPGEICDGRATFSDARAEHVLNVLHGAEGQTLKTGVLDGPVGTSVIEQIEGNAVTVRCTHETPSLQPWLDLILAPPRPRAMKRLLPQLASLGVRRIVLVGAEKVEKAFWGAQLLKEEIYRPLLIDGLQQAGTTAVPTIHIAKNFKRFIDFQFNSDFGGQSPLIVAHPSPLRGQSPTLRGQTPVIGGQSLAIIGGQSPAISRGQSPNVRGLSPVLAVGPEGGWTDEEVARLEEKGFVRMSLGPRILRTDTALIALISRLMESYDLFGRR